MLLRHPDLLARERHTLAPYAVFSDASLGRLHPEAPSELRTPFGRDRDRVLHSSSFRRLEYKTQVFSNAGDNYRTRLTHTLEVSQVARSVSQSLGLNEMLAETVVLAHDLGHPPFGHAGERILNDLMAGEGGFDHNRQTVRVVTLLESRTERYPGLNLSFEVLEGLGKHERPPGLPAELLAPHGSLEAQLADAADWLAYTAHDLDDGLRSGLLRPEELTGLPLWAAAGLSELMPPDTSLRRRALVRQLIGFLVQDLTLSTAARLEGVLSVAEVRAAPHKLLGHSPEVRELAGGLAAFLRERLYRHHRIEQEVYSARHCLSTLFCAYREYPGMLPPRWREAHAEHGLRAVCDYLAGMTDRYAWEQYRRITGGGAGIA